MGEITLQTIVVVVDTLSLFLRNFCFAAKMGIIRSKI
jgi:hypothetical protein